VIFLSNMAHLALCLFCAMSVLAASRPPTPFIDKGGCPFEGCVYREWTVIKETKLLDRPNGRRIRILHTGDYVTGLTGEVHSIPVLVHALENVPDPDHSGRTAIPKGAPFYLLHYLGEGNYLAWYFGKLVAVENFEEPRALPKEIWWVKVKTAKGVTGWALSNRNFDGQDRYG